MQVRMLVFFICLLLMKFECCFKFMKVECSFEISYYFIMIKCY